MEVGLRGEVSSRAVAGRRTPARLLREA